MEIGLGCVNLGSASSAVSPADNVRLIRAAIDGGVTVLDTANAYGSGASERIVGRAVRGRRESVTVSTKGGYVFLERSAIEQSLRRIAVTTHARARRSRPSPGVGADDGSPVHTNYQRQDFTPDHLRTSLEASLRRLRLDHVDVYQLHGPPPHADDVFAQLEDLRTAGKIGRFGVGAESIDAARAWTQASAVHVVQLPFGVLDPEARDTVVPAAGKRAISVWVRGVLGGGVLAAAMSDREATADHPKAALIERLRGIALEGGIGLDELAIRWVVSHAGIATMLIGMSSPAHLRRNLVLAASPPLPDDLREAIDAAFTLQLPDH